MTLYKTINKKLVIAIKFWHNNEFYKWFLITIAEIVFNLPLLYLFFYLLV
jgi:hypothetical protein